MNKIEKENAAIQRIMAGLKCTKEEAKEVYDYDCAVDKGEQTEFDLSAEKNKIAQKFAHTGTRKTPASYQWTTRKRKPNATKGGIISELTEFLTEKSEFSIENLQILNKERQISFKIGDETYELTLIQKRKSKRL